MSPTLLPITVAAPAVAAALLLFIPTRHRVAVRLVSLVGALVALAGSVAVALGYDRAAGGLQGNFDVALLPSVGVHLRLAADGWSASLLLLTGVVIVAAVVASFGVSRRDKEFFIWLLVLVSGVLGVFVAQDLIVFFLFYEIAVLPMYLLIGIWGSSHAIPGEGPFRRAWRFFDVGGREYAAMKLTLMLLLGSAAILVGIFALHVAAGGTSFDLETLATTTFDRGTQLWVFPVLWLGFGSLGGVFPFHTWSPDGHASAPTAVSMLHAGVLMKLGAFGVMRVGMVLCPEGAIAWAPVVGAVAVINVLYGALCAAAQKDLKYIVAYSSVSHMGIVMLGAATLGPTGWDGAVFQMVAHGVMTALLFALVGLVYERAHTRAIADMGGFGARMPGIATFFTIAGLSSLGLPGTAGFAAEMMVFLGAWQGPSSWWAIPAILGAFVTAVYVLRASRAIFWGPHERHTDVEDARGSELVAPVMLATAIIVLGVWPRLVTDLIDPTTVERLAELGGVK